MIEIEYITALGEKKSYTVQLSEDPLQAIMSLIKEKAIITDVKEIPLCQND